MAGAAASRDQFYQLASKRNEKPPQLPPRDNTTSIYSHNLPTVCIILYYVRYTLCCKILTFYKETISLLL